MKAEIILDANKHRAKIDPRIYSSFIEHLGRAIYTGIYEPSHPTADKDGFRSDVKALIRPLELPLIRYPGGNFLSGYRWEDGVGKKSLRPKRADLAWFALEPNEVGTDDFIDFCRDVGSAPMMGVNLGTRGPEDAVNLLEYCNFPSGTYYSDLRRKNGHEAPHNIKLWCLGNEMDGPWQICGKTAEEYGRIAYETAKMMKWLDPTIELVACGSSSRDMPTFGAWERTVLRHCYEQVDYISLHQYYQNLDDDIPAFLARNIEMDSFIKEVAGICREIKAEKRSDKDIYLSFDEWNVWYHAKLNGCEPEKWIVGRPLEEERYDFLDALLVGSMLITLINNSDTVKIACLAQLVNALAAIMTEPHGGAWAQSIYFPFLYASKYGRGTALQLDIDVGAYSCKVSPNAPYLDMAAVLDESGRSITLFAVNKNLDEALECEARLDNFSGAKVCCTGLFGHAYHQANTVDSQPIKPTEYDGARVESDSLKLSLPAASWSMIRIESQRARGAQ